MLNYPTQTPHSVQAVPIHSLERDTHGHLEAGKEQPRCKLIGAHVACGSGASSAIVLPNGPLVPRVHPI